MDNVVIEDVKAAAAQAEKLENDECFDEAYEMYSSALEKCIFVLKFEEDNETKKRIKELIDKYVI